MISSHSICRSLMDWEPAEGYGMDVDEKGPVETPNLPTYVTQELFSAADRDVYIAPTTVQEVHMASPILTSQPLRLSLSIIESDCSTSFLPPLEMNTKPIIFPPLSFPAIPRQALEHRVGPWETKALPLDFSSSMPAVLTYEVEAPTMASASVTHTSIVSDHGLECYVTSQNAETAPLSVVGVNMPAIPSYAPIIPSYQPEYLFASPSKTGVIGQDSPPLPSNAYYHPIYTVIPSPSKSRTNLRDLTPILTPVIPIYDLEPFPDILEERLRDDQTGDSLIKSSISAEWPDRTVGNDTVPSDGKLFVEGVTPPRSPGSPDWIVEQDITPSISHPIVAETNTPPGWPDGIVNEDAMPVSQYPVLESTTPLHGPQMTTFQEYVDSGVDLISLSSWNSNNPNSSKDDFALRAFGGSRLEDLDWILEGFRATNVPDAYIAFKNASNAFESINNGIKFVLAPLGNFSPVSPYDWALASEVSPDLIAFDSAHDLRHRSVETALVLATTHSGSFELPSFKSGHVVQTELFQTSTPTPYDRPVFEESPLAAAPTLDNMTSSSTPEIVITTCDSQSSIDCSPVSDTLDTSDVQSRSPFNPICHHGNVLVDFSKAAYTVERNALRNMKAFKSQLSLKVQKLQVRTQTSTGSLKFPSSSLQDAHTIATHHNKKNGLDIEHDVFGKIAEVSKITKSTTADASTQTENLAGAAYNLRPPRRYSPYFRYSPYWRLSRDFTFESSGSVDLENAQLIQEQSDCTVTSGTSCIFPSPEDNVFLGCGAQGSIIPTRELESGLTVRINERELEEIDREKEITFPGAFPIEQIAYVVDEPAGLPAKHNHILVDFVGVVQRKAFEAEIFPCPTIEQSASYGFEELFFRFVAYLFGW